MNMTLRKVLRNLPPSTEIAPPELQQEFLRMQTLSVETLRPIVYSQVDPVQFDRHPESLKQNEAGVLIPEEQEELTSLRVTAEQPTLRKAYAWSLLCLRGQRTPSLKELEMRSRLCGQSTVDLD